MGSGMTTTTHLSPTLERLLRALRSDEEDNPPPPVIDDASFEQGTVYPPPPSPDPFRRVSHVRSSSRVPPPPPQLQRKKGVAAERLQPAPVGRDSFLFWAMHLCDPAAELECNSAMDAARRLHRFKRVFLEELARDPEFTRDHFLDDDSLSSVKGKGATAEKARRVAVAETALKALDAEDFDLQMHAAVPAYLARLLGSGVQLQDRQGGVVLDAPAPAPAPPSATDDGTTHPLPAAPRLVLRRGPTGRFMRVHAPSPSRASASASASASAPPHT